MIYEEALSRFKIIGNFCDDYSDVCDCDCNKCDDMKRRIIEALDKQIPKKPVKCTLYMGSSEEVHYEACPNCRDILDRSNYFLKICRCGQKLEV